MLGISFRIVCGLCDSEVDFTSLGVILVVLGLLLRCIFGVLCILEPIPECSSAHGPLNMDNSFAPRASREAPARAQIGDAWMRGQDRCNDPQLRCDGVEHVLIQASEGASAVHGRRGNKRHG